MASLFRRLTLLSALILIGIGGYFLFVSSKASGFLFFGDLQNNATFLFIAAGCLIVFWIITGIINKTNP